MITAKTAQHHLAKRALTTLGLWLFCACSVFAVDLEKLDNHHWDESTLVRISDDFTEVRLSPYIRYFIDDSGLLSIANVKKKYFSEFSTYNNRDIPQNFGLSDSAIWLGFQVSNKQDKPVNAIIEMSFALIDQFDIYYSDAISNQDQLNSAHSIFTEVKGGSVFLKSKRQSKINVDIVELELPPRSKIIIFARAQSQLPVFIPLAIYSKQEYLKHLGFDKVLEGLFLGFIIGLFFYNIYVAYNTKDPCYYHITTFTFFSFIYYAGGLGYLDFLIPTGEQIKRIAYTFSACMLIITGSMLIQSFLNTKVRMPRYNKFFNGIIFLSTVAGLPSTILLPYKEAALYVVQPISFLLIIGIVHACYIEGKRGYPPVSG